jgi:hypothetical protein
MRVAICVLVSCNSPGIAIYGPRSAHGVTIEAIHPRSHTGMWASGCTLRGTIKNATEQAQTIELVAEAVVAEGMVEKHRAVHPVRATVVVPARGRSAYSAELRIRSCDRLMYVDLKSIERQR